MNIWAIIIILYFKMSISDFPPPKIHLNDQQEQPQLKWDYFKNFGKEALSFQLEDKLMWKNITYFPTINILLKILILVLNYLYPGMHNKDSELY